MHRLALTAALLMPVAMDGALIAEASQVLPEVLVVQNKSSEEKELGLDDIERLAEEVEKEEATGNYQKAIEILEQILAIEEKELGAEMLMLVELLFGLVLSIQSSVYTRQQRLTSCEAWL